MATASKVAKLKASMRESMGAGRSTDPAPALASVPIRDNQRWDGCQTEDVLTSIPIGKIAPDPGQPRKSFNPDSIAEMAAALKSQGQLQPIRVYWSDIKRKYLIVFGERRYRGALKAGLKSLDCIILDGTPDRAKLRLQQLAENMLREDVPPIEEALAFAEVLQTESWTAKRLADELGVSESRISKAIALTRLPRQVQEMVSAGTLSASSAVYISRLKEADEQVSAALDAVKTEMTRDMVEADVKARLKAKTLPGQTDMRFALEAPVEPTLAPREFPRESQGRLVGAFGGGSQAGPAVFPAAREDRRIAGWEPVNPALDRIFDYRDEDGGFVSVNLSDDADDNWGSAVALLEEALDAARFNGALSRVKNGPARPGSRVKLDDVESPFHRAFGSIMPFDPSNPGLWVEWDGLKTESGKAHHNPAPSNLTVVKLIDSFGTEVPDAEA
jgi:ParB family chromosome partitioning protein